MERLTIKNSNGCIDCGGTMAELGQEEYRKRYTTRSVQAGIKLGQLEDIEDEFGIDLVTLFKALKQGYVYKRLGTFGPIYKYNQFRIVSTHDGKIDLWAQVRLDPKKYGKRETEGWALIREELE